MTADIVQVASMYFWYRVFQASRFKVSPNRRAVLLRLNSNAQEVSESAWFRVVHGFDHGPLPLVVLLHIHLVSLSQTLFVAPS